MSGGAAFAWNARGWDSNEVDEATWEPGDPLWGRQNHGHSLYFYNFRDDTENPRCCCVDAAHWPDPGCHRIPTPFDDEDEVAHLVRLIREDRPTPSLPAMGNLPNRYLEASS